MPKEIVGIKTYSVKEVCELLGVSRRTITSYVNDGKLKGSKIGGRWVFTEKQLKEFINEGSVVDNSSPFGKPL
jgi:excisionase family DNA binding protein